MDNDAHLPQFHVRVACNFPLIRLFKDISAVIYSNLHHLFPSCQSRCTQLPPTPTPGNNLLIITEFFLHWKVGTGGADGWDFCPTEVRTTKTAHTKGAGPNQTGRVDLGAQNRPGDYLKYGKRLTKDLKCSPVAKGSRYPPFPQESSTGLTPLK